MSGPSPGPVGVFARGVAMGIAEVVPGVSGGTIAFISGIYETLLETLSGLTRQSPLDFFRAPLAYWRERNLNFLLLLGLGMGAGIVLFARILTMLLEQMPTVVWGFFFGLILASVWVIGRPRGWQALLTFGTAGVLVGLALLQLPQAEPGGTLWLFFFGGMVAVCAWILPAVSGSFMLLAMGLYAPVLAAVSAFDLVVIGTVAAGCAVGLLLFARLLSLLMARYRDPLLALLTGFMLGSLANLWPWRTPDALLSPAAYAAEVGAPMVLGVVVAAVVGAVVILLLSRSGR